MRALRAVLGQCLILVFVVVALGVSWARGHPPGRAAELGVALVAAGIGWQVWRVFGLPRR